MDLASNLHKELGDHHHDDRDDLSQVGLNGVGLGFQEPQHAVATIFGGASVPPSRRKAKLLWREVCAAAPAPRVPNL